MSRNITDHQSNPAERAGLLATPLRIAITGSSGLVGRRLVNALRADGHEVIRLVRTMSTAHDEIFWNPDRSMIDAASLEGVDAVVNLAGVSIFGARWTERRKKAIRESRVNGTDLLARSLSGLSRRPRVLVSTSAVGYYGSRGTEMLTEESAPGDGFLAGVVRDWEAAATPAAEAGIRVVHPRFGVVLAHEGGMLPLVALPFRFGVGGPLGNGRQYMSWIGLADLVELLRQAIADEALQGPVNAVAPDAVTNAEFSATLARVLGRPSFLRLPERVMRLAGGQLADELILVSQRVVPAKLLEQDFQFSYPTLDRALRHELGREDDARDIEPGSLD
ncbi:MAG TPA: TIGR01777 family oxidoreductase, partial [Thermomicrobiales bacterium]|nr:TIGR01777 family oxidoreductase [Thermomicrobiales bacterium]